MPPLDSASGRWLLLIHQIPPKPDYFRVKIWRRLQRLGAVAIKNSVYVLPRTEDTVEDLQWLLREIVEGGGEASVCQAAFVDGLTDPEIRSLFREARRADYDQIIVEAREILRALPAAGRPLEGDRRSQLDGEIARLKRRLTDVAAIDFFTAPNRRIAQSVVAELEARLRAAEVGGAAARERAARERPVRGGTWVTRRGVFVDRIASAWLIRRFIDPEARFKFVPAEGYTPKSGELRFDMFEAEYTHDGDRCTFEMLIERFGLRDAALRAIAEIVHDIDIKDAKFGRVEAVGVERLLTGLTMRNADDEARLERGGAIFDDLYAAFSAGEDDKRPRKRRSRPARAKQAPRAERR
jgi:hypothetical protein